MAQQNLLIDLDYLKSRRREIHESVNAGSFETAIRIAQDIDVYPILGSGLFNAIISQVENDNLTTLNQTLLDDYIAPALAEYAYARGLITNHYKVTAKGTQTRSGEFSEPVESMNLKQLVEEARRVADQYGERLQRYLCENSTSYPLYGNPGTGTDVQYPQQEVITNAGGFYLG